MRKKWRRVILALLLIVLRVVGPKIQLDVALVSSSSGKVVVIDPGHGGIDPGTRSKAGALEKDIVLQIAQKLETKLNSYAVYTILTRTTDTDLAPEVRGPLITRKREDLNRRAQMVKEHNADLLVSIHANSFPESKWSGAQTFYYAENGLSRVLAEAIQDSLVKNLGPNTRKAKPGDFRILRESKVPSAMVEVGFLSNPKEANLLSDPTYQDKLAEAIAKGIIEFFMVDQTSKVTAKPLVLGEFIPPSVSQNEVFLFFASSKDTGLLDYEKRTITIKTPEGVLEMLKQRPTSPDLTTVLGEQVELSYIGKTVDTAFVTVIFNGDSPSGRMEELAIYSVVNTLTLLPDIKEVVVEVVNGSEHFDWSRPLSFNNYLIENHIRVNASPVN
ncbi:MAG: N-acetylmuramoyl-L-alanine amidase CwlD [Firmicutes bacterium]|nr:N-acetylmuramoyl-L-alanine amidase CwlD [Bacillota bacterium]MDD4692912.1 N-acetylmuramoyl-L-alanine amidase CwlD [Bacillota bacterium]